MSDPALIRLAAGLKLDGFRLRHTSAGPSFRGAVEAHGAQIGLRLQYERTYSEPPYIIVETPERLPKGVVAHLDEVNDLCVVDRTAYVADRYRLAEQARGIVRRAREILARAGTKAAEAEIAEEFPRHWGGRTFAVAFGPVDGFARPVADREWLEFEVAAKPVKPPDLGAAVISTAARLSFKPGQSRPTTFAETLVWAASFDASLPERLLAGLGSIGPADPYAIIHAPNGVVGFQLAVSSKGSKVQTSIVQPKTWRRLLRGRFGRELMINRTQGRRVDTDYILGTNGEGGVAPLAGRTVTLVGCGAIGGFLAAGLAQLGAGLGGGRLLLLDHDELSARNTARHRLGAGFIGRNKAQACRESLIADLPGLTVSALPLKVEQARAQVMGANLIIDATGEQGVGDLLNVWRLDAAAGGASPALLHVWIEGAGAAARTHFSSDPAFGCYRCLQPDLAQPARWPALRPGVPPQVDTGCGEVPFSPYGPAGPMSAAGLAATHVLDWAAGHPRPLMRTHRLNLSDTVERPPTNPSRSPSCPACAGR
jgi:hypothetical protein